MLYSAMAQGGDKKEEENSRRRRESCNCIWCLTDENPGVVKIQPRFQSAYSFAACLIFVSLSSDTGHKTPSYLLVVRHWA